MPSSDRVAFYTAALAAPPLTPKHALRKTFDGGGGKAFQLRVPPDEGALHDLVKRAHASVAGASDYEASMRAEAAALMARANDYAEEGEFVAAASLFREASELYAEHGDGSRNELPASSEPLSEPPPWSRAAPRSRASARRVGARQIAFAVGGL